MLAKIFNKITEGSLRFKWVTIVLSVIFTASGVIAFTQLNQELIPKVEFPQTIVVGVNPEMMAPDMLEEVTIPLENVLSEIKGVVNVESTTSNGLSLIIVYSEFGLDQTEIRAEIKESVSSLEYPASMDLPQIINFSLSDLPIAAISVYDEEMSLDELKELVENEVVAEILAIDLIERVDISGGQALPTPEELAAAAAGSEAEKPEPVVLPESWTDGAATQNLVIETTEDLFPQIVNGFASFAPDLLMELTPEMILAFSPENIAALPEDFIASLDAETQAGIEEIFSAIPVFIPTETLSRANGNPSLGMAVYQNNEANTVTSSHKVFDKLEEFESENPNLHFEIIFEQASFIEESIDGVAQEGGLGAVFAVIIILIFLSGQISGKFKLSWRSTVVTAVSIPLSIMMAFAMFKWLPSLVDPIFGSLADATDGIPVLGAIFSIIAGLFPVGLTLNIMTLSGLTVAVGRVVDDSIVVLENIYRHIQRGDDRRMSVLKGTRDVSIAIFASTATTVVVFLPIGLMGGIVGEFFLPFGIAVTYALSASFLVAITIVPTLAYLFIRKEHLPEEKETVMQRTYTPILTKALRNKGATLAIAGVLLLVSFFLLGTRPKAFLPGFGEVQMNANVDLPEGVTMADTDELVKAFEKELEDIEGIGAVMIEIGSGGGMESLFFEGAIDQSLASITVAVENAERANELTSLVREKAEDIFGKDHVVVSSGTLSSEGFGGFALVAAAEDQQDLADFNDTAISALNELEGLANMSSNLGLEDNYLRIDGEPAIRFQGNMEATDTIGLTGEAKKALEDIAPEGITISEGFESQMQTEGFASTFQAILVSIVIVYLVMVLTFGSFVHPFTILFSLPMAIIGAALAMWISNSILGISSMVGMMMLVGIVVTNAIVLVDRVIANKKDRNMETEEALMEAGRTRLRPILMTAIAAILALVPMAIGFSKGAIIAAELAIVVIGGLTTSTLLTLLIVPVMFSILDKVSFKKKKKSA